MAPNDTIDQTNCTLATIPMEIFSGINASNDQFMGLSSISQTLTNFKEEADAIREKLSINFQNISKSEIERHISKTIKNTQAFSSQYKGIKIIFSDKKAINPSGSYDKPIAVDQITSYINQDIENELNMFSTAISKVISASKKGQSFSEGTFNLNKRRRSHPSSL